MELTALIIGLIVGMICGQLTKGLNITVNHRTVVEETVVAPKPEGETQEEETLEDPMVGAFNRVNNILSGQEELPNGNRHVNSESPVRK